MKITELFLAIGDDNLEFQNLDQCATSLDYHHKRGTTITFGTEMNIYADKGTKKLGLVMWLDREAVAAAVASHAKAQAPVAGGAK